MKLCFVGPASSAHIIKWCGYFTSRGHEVHVISFTKGDIPGVAVHFVDTGALSDSSDAKKLQYLLKARAIKKLVEEIKPDIVNAHYASSYGAAAALSGINKYVVSVWGSDIYDFPNRSPLHRLLLKYSLSKATYLFSTSRAMAAEAGKYTDKPFVITPFGVDINLFSPSKRNRENNDFVIGTVKGLSYKYGIDYLLKAAAAFRKAQPDVPLKLRIAGKGPDEKELKQLAAELGIDDITTWLGFISQEEAAKEWANMDLGIIYSSAMESFGVSALEAQASGCPLIVSNVPGLMEATEPGVTSVVVERRNVQLLAKEIERLYFDQDLRDGLRAKARDFVSNNFEYNECFRNIESVLAKCL